MARPRPERAGGRVTTRATSWGEAMRAVSVGTAAWGVPAKMMRTRSFYGNGVPPLRTTRAG